MHLTLALLKHDSYIGGMVDPHDPQMARALDTWQRIVGDTTALAARKCIRDGGETYHMTVFSPRDTRQLRKAGVDVAAITDTVDVTLTGIGSVAESLEGMENVAYYVLCESTAVDAIRARYGLPPHDLHITLGFTVQDIHNQRKDIGTKIVDLDGTTS